MQQTTVQKYYLKMKKAENALLTTIMTILKQMTRKTTIKNPFINKKKEHNYLNTLAIVHINDFITHLNDKFYNYFQKMCYSNVVFNQHITRVVDRDEVEHQRINDRVGFQARFQTAGNLIYKPPTQSTLAVTENERFNKDHGSNDLAKRQNDKQKQDNFYNARLQKRLEREQDKWEREGQRTDKQEKIRLQHQKVQLQNKRNTNGLGYNPINHAYEQSNRGQALRGHDETKDVNRYVRSKNMIERNNAGFNIITGEGKALVHQQIPQKLQSRVQQKYNDKKQRQKVRYQPKRDKYDYLDDQN